MGLPSKITEPTWARHVKLDEVELCAVSLGAVPDQSPPFRVVAQKPESVGLDAAYRRLNPFASKAVAVRLKWSTMSPAGHADQLAFDLDRLRAASVAYRPWPPGARADNPEPFRPAACQSGDGELQRQSPVLVSL